MCIKVKALRMAAQTAGNSRRIIGSGKLNSVFTGFANNVKNDVGGAFGAFKSVRQKTISVGKSQITDVNKVDRFFGNAKLQGEGLWQGTKALGKKVGVIPLITAAAGFFTAVPGGTSAGLIIGLVLKNVAKSSKKIFEKLIKKM